VVFGIAAGEPLALPVVAVPDPPPELIPVDEAPVAFDFFTASELVLVIAGLFMLSGCAAGPVLWAYEPPISATVNAPLSIAVFNISVSSLVCEQDQPDRWRNVPGTFWKPGPSRSVENCQLAGGMLIRLAPHVLNETNQPLRRIFKVVNTQLRNQACVSNASNSTRRSSTIEALSPE
jgi:hypothetical protein